MAKAKTKPKSTRQRIKKYLKRAAYGTLGTLGVAAAAAGAYGLYNKDRLMQAVQFSRDHNLSTNQLLNHIWQGEPMETQQFDLPGLVNSHLDEGFGDDQGLPPPPPPPAPEPVGIPVDQFPFMPPPEDFPTFDDWLQHLMGFQFQPPETNDEGIEDDDPNME